MRAIHKHVAAFARGEAGHIQVEYVVAAGLIAIAVIIGVKLVGVAANNQNNSTSNMLKQAGGY